MKTTARGAADLLVIKFKLAVNYFFWPGTKVVMFLLHLGTVSVISWSKCKCHEYPQHII